ncbi:MAG: C-type lectin domain-containing protein, partial [Clostridia bacterium]|nr:C-type lectin domain-containing protein [Clostridia bacterium]
MKKRVLSVLLVVALMLPLVPTSIFAEKTTDIAEHEEYLFSTNIASEGFWNNNKYSVFDKALSWTEAMEYCAQLGGHLATITTEEEQLFIESLLANGCNQKQYWIGAQRIGNGFEWITNEVWAYENWDYGQPDKSPQNST